VSKSPLVVSSAALSPIANACHIVESVPGVVPTLVEATEMYADDWNSAMSPIS